MAHNTADCRSIIVFTFDGRNTAFGAITFTLMPLLVYQASSDLTAGQRRTKISREKIKENREAKAKRKSAFLKQMKTAHMRRMSAPAMQTVPLPASPLPDLPASERPTRKRVKRDIFSPSELSVAPLASAEQPEAPIAPEVPMTQVPEAPAVKSHHAELDLGKSFVDDAVFLPGVEDVCGSTQFAQRMLLFAAAKRPNEQSVHVDAPDAPRVDVASDQWVGGRHVRRWQAASEQLRPSEVLQEGVRAHLPSGP